MNEVTLTPYGSWESPITSDLIVSDTVNLHEIVLDGSDIYWSEGRPAEDGRYAIVKWSPEKGGNLTTTIPDGYNARTRVHEYGGAAFQVHVGVLYFVNFSDQRLYRHTIGDVPQVMTPDKRYRYADIVMNAQHGRLIAVREDHTNSAREAVNTIVGVPLDGNGGGDVLLSGNDFYAAPRLSPDGRRLAWLTWNHPNMPWDGTELWLADVQADGALANHTLVAGGVDESIFQPHWSPDGRLHFVSDRSNWWNLYRWQDGDIEPLLEMEAEFGLPQWVFGMSTYGFADEANVICAYTRDGVWFLGRLDMRSGDFYTYDLPYTHIYGLQVTGDHAVFIGGQPTAPTAIVRFNLATETAVHLHQDSNLIIQEGYLSQPETITFPTENNQSAHAFYYPPQNQDYDAAATEKPPLIVISHGGPTSAAKTRFDLKIQYWTSRGFGVLDVNYGGSTGYGRRYRQRLNGQWGLVDVQDCINGARYLGEHGRVDPERLAIRGGSAGGYTTLCALTFHDVFSAGASHFGVSDAEMLAKETHKFESRYMERLIGPYPEARDIFVARSPIHFAEQINCPLILFQGLEDKVVPPNQAEMMFDAVRANGFPVAYLPFAGEQHGFRRAENIKRALDAELYFYGRVFNFELAVPVAPVPVENLPDPT